MRRNWIVIAILTLASLALGCSGADKGETVAETSETPEAMADDAVAAAPGKMAVPEGTELASVNLEGKLGCGHCSFQTKEECSLAFQDTDGNIYMIEAGDQQEALMEKRMDEPGAKIAGRVVEVDGQKVIYTDSVEL